jgi:catechol 2,3-dioxygenase-like lactoylglutathione lyase family enzyme
MFTSLRGVTYPVPDLETARTWYEQVLGREPLHSSPFAVVFLLGDAVLTTVPARPSTGPIAY